MAQYCRNYVILAPKRRREECGGSKKNEEHCGLQLTHLHQLSKTFSFGGFVYTTVETRATYTKIDNNGGQRTWL